MSAQLAATPSTPSTPVLVTGATGRQGGATARALLAAGIPVRALVRDPRADRARDVAALGAELVTGDLTDRASLDPAVAGVRAVFSVQMPPMSEAGVDFAGELAQATHLIEAARAARVPQFIQSSTSGVGTHTEIPGWGEGPLAPMGEYYATKEAIIAEVRAAGFLRWTIIKPAFFMDNLTALLPKGPEGGFATVLQPDTLLALVDPDDIGVAAAHAVQDPDRFHTVALDLAGDRLTMRQIAETLSAQWGIPVTAPAMTLEEALAAGMPAWGAGHVMNNAAPQPAHPEAAHTLAVPTTPFATWSRKHLAF
ncbi:NmrA family NAD(P)-binding protein [Streptomyces sp. SID11385]|uniref:NmrA family NAD(P)-binding protein n=1 Tax=Streptomyces sp. SID11385 TaxID=2706031 RepID=UPI0013C56743|nr:NmrA family NAD(P)-binding protein [Streptomyces sp. SID11385]NEA44695.1 NmrA family NAD(P)-binding protein [Streptomyces sp. SID11385]